MARARTTLSAPRRRCLYCNARLRWHFGFKRFPTHEAARAFVDLIQPFELRRLASIKDDSVVARR